LGEKVEEGVDEKAMSLSLTLFSGWQEQPSLVNSPAIQDSTLAPSSLPGQHGSNLSFLYFLWAHMKKRVVSAFHDCHAAAGLSFLEMIRRLDGVAA